MPRVQLRVRCKSERCAQSWQQISIIYFARAPLPRAAVAYAPDQFVSLACLCYDDPHFDHRSFHARAYEMLRQNSELADANIWCAAVAGNAAAVATFLDENPALVNRPGPNGWVPLIWASTPMRSTRLRRCTAWLGKATRSSSGCYSIAALHSRFEILFTTVPLSSGRSFSETRTCGSCCSSRRLRK